MRVTAEAIEKDLNSVLEEIKNAISSPATEFAPPIMEDEELPSPSPEGTSIGSYDTEETEEFPRLILWDQRRVQGA